MPGSCSKRLVYRIWRVDLRWHTRSVTWRRCRTIWRLARSHARRSFIGQNGDRYWLLDHRFSDQPPGPLVGHARCGFQFWHRHLSHLPSLRLHKQWPSYERGFQVPCQRECIPLRVRPVFHRQTSGCLLDRHSDLLQPGVRRRKLYANHPSNHTTNNTSRHIFPPT